MTKSKPKIIIVANDAGGAEILAAYIKSQPQVDFVSYTAGPAARIFGREALMSQAAVFDEAKKDLEMHRDATLVLTGSGWMTKIERHFIAEGKALGLKTATFLDHWVNYRERFGYPHLDWEANLPDEIWVGDKAAQQLARESFPGQEIRLVPNPYFVNFVAQYQELRVGNDEGKGLLFIGEPNTYVDTVLANLLDHLVAKKFDQPVILRPHPAEGSDRYDAILDKYSRSLAVSLSVNQNILRDFLLSRVVVGMESVALALALQCGKTTYSFITDPQVSCRVPFSDLVKIRKPEDLSAIDKLLV